MNDYYAMQLLSLDKDSAKALSHTSLTLGVLLALMFVTVFLFPFQ